MSSGNAITPEVVAAPAATSTTVPVPVDPVAVFFTNFINQLMTGVAAPAIEAAAEAQVPFLALPIVKQLFEAIVNELAGKLSRLASEKASTAERLSEAASHAMQWVQRPFLKWARKERKKNAKRLSWLAL